VARASSSPKIGHSPRRRAAWSGRATGAVLASAFAHAVAAVTVGAVLQTLPPAPVAPAAAQPVDVDVALEVDAPASPRDEPRGPAPEVARPQRGIATAARATAARRSRETLVHVASAGAPAPVVDAPSSEEDETPPSLFVLSAGTVATRAVGVPAGASSTPGAGTGSASDGDAVGERDVSEPARLLSSSPLVYPPAARQAEIEIDFPVEIVVDAQGRVISTRAVTHAGYGLDEAALRAIRAYRFSPARRAGRPVGVRMRWTVQFRLR
jgi:periplasmic protein TonB